MGSSLKIYLYGICWLIFVSNQLLQNYFNVIIPFANSYLDDLLFFPILMPILQLIYFLLTGNRRFGWAYLISFYVYLSCIAEFAFPYFSAQYTTDYFDFVAYAIGMTAYIYVDIRA